MSIFGARITFLTVYILEAHTADTWPIGSDVVYNQTKNLEDKFNTLFAAWPLRFYVIDGKTSKLNYICEPFGDIIAVSDLHAYLDWFFKGTM